MADEHEITVVRAIYLDTNAAREAGFQLSAPWMQRLCQQAQDLSISLYIPQLVLDEWLHYLCENGRTKLTKIRESRCQLNEMLERESITLTIPSDSIVLEELRKAHISRVQKADFEIIPNAVPDVSSLIQKAVQKEPPFEAGDKGFRDAIIVETIAEHVSEHHRNDQVVVVSADNAFCAGIKASAIARGLRTEICNTRSLNMRIEQSLEAATQKLRELELGKVLEFLCANRKMIYAHVRNSRIPEWSLTYKQDVLDPLYNANIKRVNSVAPKKIEAILARLGFLSEEPGTTGIPILFSVIVDLNLTIEKMDPAYLLGSRSIPLNAPSELAEEPLSDSRPPFMVNAEVTVEHSISLHAIATRSDNTEHPLEDLQIVEDISKLGDTVNT